MTEEDFLAVIRVNLGAAYELTRALTYKQARSVVSLASRAYLGNFGQFNYSASKGGLVGMTRALALEMAPRRARERDRPEPHRLRDDAGDACQRVGEDDRDDPPRPPG